MGRSMRREVRISLVVGRPSRLMKPPGNLPATKDLPTDLPLNEMHLHDDNLPISRQTGWRWEEPSGERMTTLRCLHPTLQFGHSPKAVENGYLRKPSWVMTAVLQCGHSPKAVEKGEARSPDGDST